MREHYFIKVTLTFQSATAPYGLRRAGARRGCREDPAILRALLDHGWADVTIVATSHQTCRSPLPLNHWPAALRPPFMDSESIAPPAIPWQNAPDC